MVPKFSIKNVSERTFFACSSIAEQAHRDAVDRSPEGEKEAEAVQMRPEPNSNEERVPGRRVPGSLVGYCPAKARYCSGVTGPMAKVSVCIAIYLRNSIDAAAPPGSPIFFAAASNCASCAGVVTGSIAR